MDIAQHQYQHRTDSFRMPAQNTNETTFPNYVHDRVWLSQSNQNFMPPTQHQQTHEQETQMSSTEVVYTSQGYIQNEKEIFYCRDYHNYHYRFPVTNWTNNNSHLEADTHYNNYNLEQSVYDNMYNNEQHHKIDSAVIEYGTHGSRQIIQHTNNQHQDYYEQTYLYQPEPQCYAMNGKQAFIESSSVSDTERMVHAETFDIQQQQQHHQYNCNYQDTALVQSQPQQNNNNYFYSRKVKQEHIALDIEQATHNQQYDNNQNKVSLQTVQSHLTSTLETKNEINDKHSISWPTTNLNSNLETKVEFVIEPSICLEYTQRPENGKIGPICARQTNKPTIKSIVKERKTSVRKSSTGLADGKVNKCRICERHYARPSTLKTHLRTHTNERPYCCMICLKTFSQAANLTAHQRVHTGERPFSCPICGRQFSQSSSVITHLRTHSGERPYRCDLCSRTFSDSSTLTKHCRIHSGEKPYQCGFCTLNFSQSGNLSRHLKLHTSNSSSSSTSSATYSTARSSSGSS